MKSSNRLTFKRDWRLPLFLFFSLEYVCRMSFVWRRNSGLVKLVLGWLVVVFVVVEGLGNSKGVRRVGIHVQYQTEKKYYTCINALLYLSTTIYNYYLNFHGF